MINDDIIIKIERERGYKYDWPEQVNLVKQRLQEVKLGFPGIRNEHLSLVKYSTIKPGDIFIYDQYLESKTRGDEAPMMLKWLDQDKYYIEGIGCGVDSKRDPDRINYRWKDIISCKSGFPGPALVLRVDVRPTLNGGPGYYYFFKAYRDNRL